MSDDEPKVTCCECGDPVTPERLVCSDCTGDVPGTRPAQDAQIDERQRETRDVSEDT
ncbi:MAG: hypothetical protein ABEN55_00480 [Bradymonadaceae bacterium]